MPVFYNDNDAYSCGQIRKNVRNGYLPGGVIDERPIEEVRAEDIREFRQAHFFAGIGGFPLGFRWAGVPEDFSIWTGGDPCQGNSKSRGSRAYGGPDTASHFIRLIDECRPRFVLRENPSSTLRHAPWPWFRFRSELERIGYAVLPFRIRSCCVGADHRRERLFLLAEFPNAMRTGLERKDSAIVQHGDAPRPVGGPSSPRICGAVDGIPNRVDRIRALGNSVDPRVVELIGRFILKSVSTSRGAGHGRI